MTQEITFRPAKPDDVDVAVPLIYSSGPIAFDYVFASQSKGNGETFLKYAFQDGAGEFGYRNHVVGTRDGEIVCAGAGYTGETGMAFTLAAVRQIWSFYGLNGIGVIIRGLRIEQVIEPPSKDLYYIAHLGVKPELRGQGIGTQLLNHLLSQQYTAGIKTAALDVAVTNPRAEALYKRMGFTVTETLKSNLSNQWGTVADLRRMEKSLK